MQNYAQKPLGKAYEERISCILGQTYAPAMESFAQKPMEKAYEESIFCILGQTHAPAMGNYAQKPLEKQDATPMYSYAKPMYSLSTAYGRPGGGVISGTFS